MKRSILAATLLAGTVLATPASADVIATGFFTSDHCTGLCGDGSASGQPGGFGQITATDHQNGTIDVLITLNNNNTFTNGGQDVVFGFNLIGSPTLTYTNLNTALWNVVQNPDDATLVQSAGALHANGFGTFQYGVDLVANGPSNISSLAFSITGDGLDYTDFAKFSTDGNPSAMMALDIFSGTTGNTGFVDLSLSPTPGQQCTDGICAVPGPIIGAGIPGLIAGCMGLLGLGRWRRRRESLA